MIHVVPANGDDGLNLRSFNKPDVVPAKAGTHTA